MGRASCSCFFTYTVLPVPVKAFWNTYKYVQAFWTMS